MRAHDQPGMIIDSRQALQMRPIAQREPAHDIHLPQLHRRGPLPPLPGILPTPPRTGLDHPGTTQRPIHPRLTRHRTHAPPGQLMHQTPRTPPPMLPAQLQHQRLDIRRHLRRRRPRSMRMILQARQALSLVPGKPRMHALPRHPEPASHLNDRAPIGDHRQNGLITLLRHSQLPQHGESVNHHPTQPSRINRNTVTHHPTTKRPGSPEAIQLL